ncbi:MAG: efflux RND transporter periplasmic adaptor subunit [Bacteroidales bacterium]|nr:efflux RND transporter periplasmic adaptor subunit [Candidatus Cryptobacteroides aphodequi]
MKKIIGILVGALAVLGIVLLLAGNKKKIQEQTTSVAQAEGTEVVTTCTVTKEECNRDFTSNGLAQASGELNFVSEVSGRVTAVYVDKGSKVNKGTALLKIDSDLLEADYKAARASYDALKKDEERFSRSYEAGGVTIQQLDNIRTQLVAAESRLAVSKWKLDNAVVKAPIGGTINNRFVEPGALIAPNVPLFEIVDDSRIKVICNVPESKARLISAGQKVSAVSADSGSGNFTGTVKNIGIKADRGLNYPVEILLDRNADLRVGMYLKVRFETSGDQGGILVPRKAVVGSVLSANVYVAENGKAVKRDVTLGEMFGDKIEILSGLEEGEKVIVAGLMNVSDGVSIRVVNEQ